MADTTFHGWTVDADEDGNVVTLTKPSEHPSAKNGVLLVRTRGGNGTPHAITRATAERDALAEDVRTASPDDLGEWQDRHEAAHAKVKRLRDEHQKGGE
jgi:hypothetical protein